MSVVSVAFNKNGVLLMGDTKVTISNGGSKRVVKVMKHVNHMFGVTGTMSDIYDFFYPLIKNDFTINDTYEIPEQLILDYLDGTFYRYVKDNKELDVKCVVVLKRDNIYIVKFYNLLHRDLFKNVCYINTTSEFHMVTLGLDETTKLINTNFHDIKPKTKNECISLFKESVTEAMKRDNSINNEIIYEELGDFIYGES